jgi:methylmalonyl-CoA mutase C-terminal domain/subunit
MGMVREQGLDNKLVAVGGVIPNKDIPALKEMGVEGIFPGGSYFNEIVEFIEKHVPVR